MFVIAAVALLSVGCGLISIAGVGDSDKSFSVAVQVLEADGSGVLAVLLLLDEKPVSTTDQNGRAELTGLLKPQKLVPVREGYSFYPEHIRVSESTGLVTFLATISVDGL